ncbi:hypothetical protein GS597_06480 [Synechococcales cyanobacterium C]|uniref:Uncharacterized protein n=1 Tax=Petrachloros mirabilis ULC683 TaxID=2781853 RepID=A0A8K1ZWH5_9CYAN|nr:hypothetical protein [Petrachloros mirabilis ULC683]
MTEALTQIPTDFTLELPDPEDEQISEPEFQHQIEMAWQVCDRFDLQTDIWRGRLMRTVRDREKRNGEGRGMGFLNWLQEHDISKSQAYSWIELANSADQLLSSGQLEPGTFEQFSKRAFVETAQAAPEVQQLVSEAARQGERITRREVRQLSDEWTAMSSDLLPEEVKTKAAANTIPPRYLAPLVRELEKLPEPHQAILHKEMVASPELDTLKEVTNEARQLAKYLNATTHVQALADQNLHLEQALAEALRLGCLNSAADLVSQAAQLEQSMAKLFATWKRLRRLSERVYLESGASTPHLRSLLQALDSLCGETLHLELGQAQGTPQQVSVTLATEPHDP